MPGRSPLSGRSAETTRNSALSSTSSLAQKGAPGSSLETERKNMLASQLWTKVRFITDDTNRLMEISQSRIVSAQGKAAVAVLALLVAVILTNATISFVSGRSIVRDVKRLSEGVGHISGGDLAHRIEVLGKNELADLAGAFNGMAASLQASYDRLREYTQKLEQSNRELQDFAFVASHDLQEPLRKIQTFGDRREGQMRATVWTKKGVIISGGCGTRPSGCRP